MASLTLKNVTADFPIYGASSFRKELVGHTIGGLMRRSNGRHKRVTVRALDNISMKINHGDQLGIVGHNGAGKSTLLRVLAGIYEPTAGRCIIDGRVSPLFITAPGLSPEDTGYENIITCGLLLGMTREEIDRKTDDIGDFAELGDYLSLPVRTYSTGMQTRLGFAIATAIDPEVLLLDEGLGAGDERFAMRAAQRVEALIERSNIMVLASHSRELILRMCNRAILMHHGRILADGDPKEILERYEEIAGSAEASAQAAPASESEPDDDAAAAPAETPAVT